jgi:predicted dehydrogenase
MPHDTKVGLIGVGDQGLGHAEELDALGYPFVGVDLSKEMRSHFLSEFDVPTYESLEQMYEAEDVDAVVVSTPNKFHERVTKLALAQGSDVLLVKPLAHTLESAERIAAAARDSEAFCMIGLHYRFYDHVQVLGNLIREGRLGEVTHVEGRYVRRRGIPPQGTGFTSREIAGGGAVMDLGPHVLDLVNYFYDYEDVAEVCGTTRREFGDRSDYTYLETWGQNRDGDVFNVEDSGSAFLRFDDGRTASVEMAWAANCAETHEYVVRGTEGGARLELPETDPYADPELTLFGSGTAGADYLSDTAVQARGNNSTRTELESFVRHVESGDPPTMNTVEQGLAVQRLIAAIYDSSETERGVELDDA